MASKRTCICCNEKYSYCPSCGSDRLKPTWYTSFCCETCKDLWQTLSKYSMGFIEKKDAMEVIKALSLKDKSKYVECVQRDMAKVLTEEPKLKRNKKVDIAPIQEETPQLAIEEVAPKAAKTPVVEKTETIPAPEKAEPVHEVVDKTEEK